MYNVASGKSHKLLNIINILEGYLKKKAKKKFLPIQKGDIVSTCANINNLKNDYNYKPKVNIKSGLKKFINWYLEYQK